MSSVASGAQGLNSIIVVCTLKRGACMMPLFLNAVVRACVRYAIAAFVAFQCSSQADTCVTVLCCIKLPLRP